MEAYWYNLVARLSYQEVERMVLDLQTRERGIIFSPVVAHLSA